MIPLNQLPIAAQAIWTNALDALGLYTTDPEWIWRMITDAYLARYRYIGPPFSHLMVHNLAELRTVLSTRHLPAVTPKWKAVTCANRHVKLFTEDECDTS